ncbi:MAG: fimbrillin family protein [Bacteroidales bacterium]|nr:fimbrillin family protein [Bacteroidales bacterium]
MKKKNNYIIYVIALTLFSTSSCQINEYFGIPRQGHRITFKTATSYKNAATTKTVYSGDGDYEGEILVRERIDWVSGDEIRIWSDKASLPDGSANWADYIVTPTSNSGANSYATVSNKAANGLVWGEGTHEFYSLYPSPASGGESASVDGKTISAFIPPTQTYTIRDGKLMPDMDYAYMYAALRTEASSSVALSFKPMFTAFEITVDSADDATMTLTSFELSSSSSGLSGSFTATLTADTDGPSSTASYSVGETGNSVRLVFDGGLIIKKGEAKSFTVFTLPIDASDLTIRFTTSKGEEKTLALNLSDGNPVVFSGGKKYRITSLGIPGSWSYSMENIPSITLSTNAEKVYGGDRDITVVSRRTRGSTALPFPWRAQAQVDGNWIEANDPRWPDWLSLSAYSGDGNNNIIRVHVGPNVVQKFPLGGIGAGIAEELSLFTEHGTRSSPFDLSRHDIYGASNSGNLSTTANCYIIGAPGWYMFPLVYGNAIKNGVDNTRAYRPLVTSSLAMSSFVGADGNAITSPYILQDSGLSLSGEYDACIVWEDVMPGYGIIDPESVEIVDSPDGAGLSCPYLRFHISSDDIKPGNVVLALRDKGNGDKILWNWHIWITRNYSNELQTSSVVYRPGTASTASLQFMNVNLGWTPPISYEALQTTGRSIRLRFIQDAPGTAYKMPNVTQQAYNGTVYQGLEWGGTYYQWGRKDPFLPARGYIDGNANVNRCSSSPAGYTITSGTSGVPQSSHSGSMESLYRSFIREPYRMFRSDHQIGALNAWDADNTQFVSDSPVLKTVYDPCPPGFTVPRFRAFTGFTFDGGNATAPSEIYGDFVEAVSVQQGYPCGWMFTSSGTTSNKTVYVPIVGMRNYNGTIVSIGDRGYYWTSGRYDKTNPVSVYSESGFFTRTRVDPLYNVPSGHAMSVRPVREQ